jgi:hypothetical protein
MHLSRGGLCGLLVLPAGMHTCDAFFPDLSGYPANTTLLTLAEANITDIPAGAFDRFTALLFL